MTKIYSGHSILVGDNLVSWKSKKHMRLQILVQCRSRKLKYECMTVATCEHIWSKKRLKEKFDR